MNVFVTGITGSLGTELTRLLIEDNHKIFGVSRSELNIKNFQYASYVDISLGNICDYNSLSDVVEKAGHIDVIFHLAALKHVELGEEYPERFIKTNVQGTMNVMALQRRKKIPKVVLSATDKGVRPINVYGCTKQIAEKLVLKNKNNAVCRYGNVFGSNGSLVTTLKSKADRGQHNQFELTHEDMTRYMIKIEDAAQFVYAARNWTGVNIPEMESVEIKELIMEFINIYCPEGSYRITGMRPGEKIHEDIAEGKTSYNAKRISKEGMAKLFKGIW